MIPPIQIDLSEVAEEFELKSAQIDELGTVMVNAITDRIFYNWQNAAKQTLKSTRKLYLNSLQIGTVGPHQKFIILSGDLPNMIEKGAGAFDMKKGFENSPNAKIKKNGGWYITVPFRHATPDALGESEIFANVMPKSVYKVAKTLAPKRTQVNVGNISAPTNLGISMIPRVYQRTQVRPAVSNLQTQQTFDKYRHKNSIYEGMIREEKVYENATQSTYITFRRVSDKSDVNSWIHRGIMAHNFAQKGLAQTDVGNIADRVTDEFLIEIGKG